jgi:hypothetical protein
MIDTCVTRIPGCCVPVTEETPLPDICVVGETISNSLILTEIVAGSVARALIDSEQQDKEIVQSVCNAIAYLKPTSLIEAEDKEIGKYRGKLKKFSINISKNIGGSFSCRSSLEIERVLL